MMENKEGTIIGLGCLALGCLFYFYAQSNKEKELYSEKKKETIDCLKKCNKDEYKINYGKLKEKGETEVVFIPLAQSHTISETCFRRFNRQRPFMKERQPSLDKGQYLENQAGGTFEITDLINHQSNVLVDLRNCNIDSKILQEKREKIIIFEQNASKRSNFESAKFTLDKQGKFAILGVLGYSISEQRFIIRPSFMTVSFGSKSIIDFWRQKMYPCQFKSIILCLTMGLVFFSLIIKPIHSIIKRYQHTFKEISKNDMDYFRMKPNYYAKLSSALVCQKCNTNNVNIVYDCGHLGICEDCHKAEDNKKCLLCGKVSKQFLKIFL